MAGRFRHHSFYHFSNQDGMPREVREEGTRYAILRGHDEVTSSLRLEWARKQAFVDASIVSLVRIAATRRYGQSDTRAAQVTSAPVCGGIASAMYSEAAARRDRARCSSANADCRLEQVGSDRPDPKAQPMSAAPRAGPPQPLQFRRSAPWSALLAPTRQFMQTKIPARSRARFRQRSDLRAAHSG